MRRLALNTPAWLVMLLAPACHPATEPAPSPSRDSAGAWPVSPVAATAPAATAKTAEGAPTQRQRDAPILITDHSQREAAVGKRVTVVGIQTRTKQPQVNGIDVDGDDELSDRRVRVDGVLHKHVVEPRDPDPDELPFATRGPGIYYAVVDPITGTLARPRPE